MPVHRLRVNGTMCEIDTPGDTPLLWALREDVGLTGAKYGCGIGACGACVSLVDGSAARTCVTEVAGVAGRAVTTIEGLPPGHPVRRAWLIEDVAQCGYCQPGQIMSAVALLAANPDPLDADIDRAMRDNVCRCGTYSRIRRAIHLAAQLAKGASE